MKRILALVLILALWQFSYFMPVFNSAIIPPPSEIGVALLGVLATGEIIIHIIFSLKRVLIGFLAAAIIGISTGLALGHYKRAREIAEPIIEILRPIPPIAWIPIAILLFGLGDNSAYFIVFLGAFFPIFTNTAFGALSLPKIYDNLALTLEIKKKSYFKDILFKFSMPFIFTGLKIGMGMAWMSVIAAELIGAQSGLGYFIQMNRLLLRTDKIIAGMLLIGLAGYLLIKIVSAIEKIAIPWKDDKKC